MSIKSADGLYHINISFDGKRYLITGKIWSEVCRKAGKLKSEPEIGRRLGLKSATVKSFAPERLAVCHKIGKLR